MTLFGPQCKIDSHPRKPTTVRKTGQPRVRGKESSALTRHVLAEVAKVQFRPLARDVVLVLHVDADRRVEKSIEGLAHRDWVENDDERRREEGDPGGLVRRAKSGEEVAVEDVIDQEEVELREEGVSSTGASSRSGSSRVSSIRTRKTKIRA